MYTREEIKKWIEKLDELRSKEKNNGWQNSAHRNNERTFDSNQGGITQ